MESLVKSIQYTDILSLDWLSIFNCIEKLLSYCIPAPQKEYFPSATRHSFNPLLANSPESTIDLSEICIEMNSVPSFLKETVSGRLSPVLTTRSITFNSVCVCAAEQEKLGVCIQLMSDLKQQQENEKTFIKMLNKNALILNHKAHDLKIVIVQNAISVI